MNRVYVSQVNHIIDWQRSGGLDDLGPFQLQFSKMISRIVKALSKFRFQSCAKVAYCHVSKAKQIILNLHMFPNLSVLRIDFRKNLEHDVYTQVHCIE